MNLAVACLALLAVTLSIEARERQPLSPATLDGFGLPNPILTPGGINPAATLDVICSTTTKARRNVTPATRAKVLADYNQPTMTTEDYELDRLVPLCLGGNNAAANLWAQPAPDYYVKDKLEFALCSYVCLGRVPLVQAQAEIAGNWIGAAKRYLGW